MVAPSFFSYFCSDICTADKAEVPTQSKKAEVQAQSTLEQYQTQESIVVKFTPSSGENKAKEDSTRSSVDAFIVEPEKKKDITSSPGVASTDNNSATTDDSTVCVGNESDSSKPINAEETITKLLLGDVWSGDEKVVVCALQLINICLEKEPQAAKAMKSVGAYSILIGLLRKWLSSYKIQAHGCHFIAQCCRHDSNDFNFANAAVGYGILPRIEKAMLKYPKYLMVQTAACEALEQILMHVSREQQSVIVKTQALHVELVVTAMDNMPTTVVLQKTAMGILEIASRYQPRDIVQAGGIEALGVAYHRFCDAEDKDQVEIRARTRRTIPNLVQQSSEGKSHGFLLSCGADTTL